MVSQHTLREKSRQKVFQNRILMRILGPNMDANGDWRELHNEELHSLYHPHNIVRVINSRKLKRAGHVVRMEGRISFKMLTGAPKETDI